MLPPLRIATRSSQLALWQAEHVADCIRAANPDRTVELVRVSTHGDREQKESLAAMGGAGVFTREVQRAVLDGRADLAVHSLKDLPTVATPGLTLAAVPPRADVDDALILPLGVGPSDDCLTDLPSGARVGTGSPRRRAQLLHLRPDLVLHEIRGNVDTRLRKLDSGEYDAIVLAVAGLSRLGWAERISQRISPPCMFYAVGQGALGIECRADDAATISALSTLDDAAARRRVTAERALLAALRAGCHAPVGVAASSTDLSIRLEGVVLNLAGTERIHAAAEHADPIDVANLVATQLLSAGADRLMGH